jgi:hypothetical protein
VVVGEKEAEEAEALEVHHHIPLREISREVLNIENYLTRPTPPSHQERICSMSGLPTFTRFAHLEDQMGAAEEVSASRVFVVDMLRASHQRNLQRVKPDPSSYRFEMAMNAPTNQLRKPFRLFLGGGRPIHQPHVSIIHGTRFATNAGAAQKSEYRYSQSRAPWPFIPVTLLSSTSIFGVQSGDVRRSTDHSHASTLSGASTLLLPPG